jgi:hypothetical protein
LEVCFYDDYIKIILTATLVFLMLSNTQILAQSDPRDVSKTALNVFFKITGGWRLAAADEMVLLGQPSRSTFFKWRKGEGPVIGKDTLERISYVMGIYKALRCLFASTEQANAWPHKANRDFNGESVMAFMLKGSVTDLCDVRRYLDAMRG